MTNIEKIREALEPFAKAFKQYPSDSSKEMIAFLDSNKITPSMTMGDYRRLAEALALLDQMKPFPSYQEIVDEFDLYPMGSEKDNLAQALYIRLKNSAAPTRPLPESVGLALARGQRKLHAYLGVCKDDKELPKVIEMLKLSQADLEKWEKNE